MGGEKGEMCGHGEEGERVRQGRGQEQDLSGGQ